MDSAENHIRQIQEAVESEGYALYDVYLSNRRNGVLRVFITAPSDNKQLLPTLEACSRISKKILDHPNVEELIPWESTLEVSSPGINRKLKTAEHMAGAVGERIALKHRNQEGKNEILKGVLKSFDGSVMNVEPEAAKATKKKKSASPDNQQSGPVEGSVTVRFEDVIEAKADFKF